MKLKYKNGSKFDTYIPLHGHSTYSLGDGVARLSDIVSKTKEIGANAVGLTEHGNMLSFFKFYNEAKANDVIPIIGVELYVNDLFYDDKEAFLKAKRSKGDEDENELELDAATDTSNAHFVVYCKNLKGMHNLIHLSNIGFFNFYRKPLVKLDMMFEHLDENNIVTTGCVNSPFNKLILLGKLDEAEKLLKRFKKHFKDDFYFEIQANGMEEQKIVNDFYEEAHTRHNVKPVFALDYHYANKEDYYIQYLSFLIKNRHTVESMPLEDWFYTVRNLHIKDIDEVYEVASDININFLELALNSTFEIRDKIEIDIPTYPNNYPKYTESDSETDKLFLEVFTKKYKEKIDSGVIPKDRIKEYDEVIEKEIQIFKKKDFINYLMIISDILDGFVYASGGSTGAGRGSAAGSLILFIMDVTKIDPVKHDLMFERFLNADRKDPADVDIDIDSVTQKKVEGYIKDRYGEEKVCHIINFAKFGAKTAVKDLCRIFKLDYNLSNALTGYFDTLRTDLPIGEELDKTAKIAKTQGNAKLVKFIEDNRDTFIELGSRLVGMVRQTGKHASGILISNKELANSDLPIYKVKGEIVTGVQEGGDEREVSELGYCKLDLLGLITASVIKDSLNLAEGNHKLENIERELLTSEFDDEGVYEQFALGNCRDIFQFGSDGMIQLIKTTKPTNIEDLSALNAMYRPASLQGGQMDMYVECKKDPDIARLKYEAMHPDLWKILQPTYGALIYQEQVLLILREIGGFTIEEADNGRKVMKLLHKGNQEKTDDFFKMLDKFKRGAKEKGISEEDTDWLLDIMGKYSEYCFNRSHSLAYSINAYVSMWLKVHYPLEYYIALLNNSTATDIGHFMKTAKVSGIKFKEFVVGNSDIDFSIDQDSSIKIGLTVVKGLASKDYENIIDLNKCNDVNELVKTIKKIRITKRSFEPLCRLGYFKNIFENSAMLEKILNEIKVKKKTVIEEEIEKITSEEVEDYSDAQKLAFEKKYLQFYLSKHPFEQFRDFIEKEEPEMLESMLSPKQTNDLIDGKYIVYGVITDIIMKKSKNTGREYFRLLLEDDEQHVYVTIFNVADMRDIGEGDLVIIETSKNNFGFAKASKSRIYKFS